MGAGTDGARGAGMRIVLFAIALATFGCTSTYHPEYHPVSVLNVTTSGQPVVIGQPPLEPFGR
jgi:hypothetical protein